jgi:putative two-component system response regulator
MSRESRALILVVDDDEDIRNLFAATLQSRYEVELAASGREALLKSESAPRPDLILLDIQLPDLDGYAVCARLKSNPVVAPIPVIFVTGFTDIKNAVKGLGLGAVDYITKPVSTALLLARVATHLALYDQRRALEGEVRQRTQELYATRLQIIRRLACAMEYREGGLSHRVMRVSHYVRLLALELGVDDETVQLLFEAVPLYDIGKLGVPDYILRSADRLNKVEWQEMQRHPEIGAAIIGEHHDPLLSVARGMALSHHERWDGQGYPNRLAGERIPLAARILALADAFEAMTSTQRHRRPIAARDAAVQLFQDSGKQFDPRVVAAFRKLLPQFEAIIATYKDELEGIHDLDFVAGPAAVAAGLTTSGGGKKA